MVKIITSSWKKAEDYLLQYLDNDNTVVNVGPQPCSIKDLIMHVQNKTDVGKQIVQALLKLKRIK